MSNLAQIPPSLEVKKRAAPKTAWKKGQSGNPKGRPKFKFISDAYKHIMENEEQAEIIARKTVHLAKEAKHPSVKLAAIREITDRTEGRPMQSLRVEQSLSPDDARRLTLIAESLGILADKELDRRYE